MLTNVGNLNVNETKDGLVPRKRRRCAKELPVREALTPFVSSARRTEGARGTHQQPQQAIPPLGLTSRHPEPQALLPAPYRE